MNLSLQHVALAARPKTLTAAVVPILVGSALSPTFSGMIALCCLLASLAIQVGTNLFNDALDFKKGADTHERIGPTRVTQSGALSFHLVMFLASLSFLLGALFTAPLILIGGVPILILLVLSLISGYIYTGGPYPLAYRGLGEVFVFLFFGLIATMGVYYLNTGTLTMASFIAGVQIGLLATTMIAINNLRDRKTDVVADKRTLAVRFGKTFGRCEISALLLVPYLFQAYWMYEEKPFAFLFPFLSLPIALSTLRGVWLTEPSKGYNNYLARSALCHLSFGVLLALGLFFK